MLFSAAELKQPVLRFDPLPHGALPDVNLKSPPSRPGRLAKKKKIAVLCGSTATVGPPLPRGVPLAAGGLGPPQLPAPRGDPASLLWGLRGAPLSSLCRGTASAGEPGSPVWHAGGRGKGGKKGREMKGVSLSGTGVGGGHRRRGGTEPGGLQNSPLPSSRGTEAAGSN